ncbi:MAG: multiple resistance and pH regulation protein F [Kofleriaceae bacterium]|nr:multiple resistance and pH regulation protein F [Kofleriaceae bacterium]MCL4224557.1 hypothetical protein [Myxococcales bacterium]
MAELRAAVALFLVLTVLVGMIRVARGPSFADRMLVALLMGTTGVAVLVLLAASPGAGALRDVALVLSLLASVTVVAFARLAASGREPAAGPTSGPPDATADAPAAATVTADAAAAATDAPAAAGADAPAAPEPVP